MSNKPKPGCTVFVGNIDFDVPEERIVQELGRAGKVVSFRLLLDKNTGRSKGYGFAEYESPEIAEQAMRTLKISFNGRAAKINYAENDLPTKITEESDLKKELVAEEIARAVDEDAHGAEIIGYVKSLAVDNPSHLREMLHENPSLVCAVMHLFLSMPGLREDAMKALSESLDVNRSRAQIESRILSMTQKEMEHYGEDVRNRLVKLRFQLQRK
ncbi:CTF64 [Enterospora canceri]|uniref:CTF64 n=1 Tax=Enterospora canceri TaxID=1081671 RepID=A0A1Y1S747_9MICR|nr:CTF64 [Enterospora canceri]